MHSSLFKTGLPKAYIEANNPPELLTLTIPFRYDFFLDVFAIILFDDFFSFKNYRK